MKEGGMPRRLDRRVPDSATAERNQSILKYKPLVDKIAARMIFKFPPHVLLEDITSVGIFGLYDALAKFQPSEGVPFEQYAEIRIRGAIVDYLRTEDKRVGRTRRSWLKKIDQAKAKLGPGATRSDIAQELNVHLNQLNKMIDESGRKASSLEDTVKDTSLKVEDTLFTEEIDLEGALDDYNFLQSLSSIEIKDYDSATPLMYTPHPLLRGFTQREAYVLQQLLLHHSEKQDIAEQIGVTPSRISQTLVSLNAKIKRNQKILGLPDFNHESDSD